MLMGCTRWVFSACNLVLQWTCHYLATKQCYSEVKKFVHQCWNDALIIALLQTVLIGLDRPIIGESSVAISDYMDGENLMDVPDEHHTKVC